MSFGHRGFAVGTAYSKTEAVQAAIIALVLLGEALRACCLARHRGCRRGGRDVSLAGGARARARRALRATVQPAALYGLGRGLRFALCASACAARNQALTGADPTCARC